MHDSPAAILDGSKGLFTVSRVDVIQQIDAVQLEEVLCSLLGDVKGLLAGPKREDIAELKLEIGSLREELQGAQETSRESLEALQRKQASVRLEQRQKYFAASRTAVILSNAVRHALHIKLCLARRMKLKAYCFS